MLLDIGGGDFRVAKAALGREGVRRRRVSPLWVSRGQRRGGEVVSRGMRIAIASIPLVPDRWHPVSSHGFPWMADTVLGVRSE